MRASQYFLPTLKEAPSDATIVSHQYMLRAGMIRQSASGIYSWLPLGLRVLRKVEEIVRQEQDAMGAVELLMPTIQAADLWKKSGRYDDYGAEMLRIEDRHGRELLYGPTNEELITDIFRKEVSSYKNLPKILYHIQWKFRDEVRPRFGVMRGREFFMKDGYSFDVSEEAAEQSYRKIFLSYLQIFERLGLKAIPMKADTGPIGGDLSHEFIILADTGESEVFLDERLLEQSISSQSFSYTDQEKVSELMSLWTSCYARTDETHDQDLFEKEVTTENRVSKRGIEVGHIFYFGTKYSEPLGALVNMPDGKMAPLHMGSYGIGVSRLVGALIEAFHDDRGIIWPKSVTPFDLVLINIRPKDSECTKFCDDLYAQLQEKGVSVYYDERDERPGAKFADADLIGVPWQLVVGPKGLENGTVELIQRQKGGNEKEELSLESALAKILA